MTLSVYPETVSKVTLAMPGRAALERKVPLTGRFDLREQNRRFQGSGGISQENRSYGFLPAFCDADQGAVYLSRWADGRLAPIHLLEGLPLELVLTDPVSQRIVALKASVIAGFVRAGQFYTRQEVAQALPLEQGDQKEGAHGSLPDRVS